MRELKLNTIYVVMRPLKVDFTAYPINESSDIRLATFHPFPCFVLAEGPVAELLQLRTGLQEERICFLQMRFVVINGLLLGHSKNV